MGHLARWTDLKDHSSIHDSNPIGEAKSLQSIVRGEDGRRLCLL